MQLAHSCYLSKSAHCYFLSCYFFSYLPTVSFSLLLLSYCYPDWINGTITYFPNTCILTCPLLLSFLLLFFSTCPLFLFFLSLYSYCYPNELLLSFLFLFFPLVHCYFLSCYFFSYLSTVTFFPVTFFPVTFFPTWNCYFLSCYLFSCYFLSVHHRFLSSWGQRARVKLYNIDLSSWYEFWFALICIDMNVISALSTAIEQFRDGFDSK